MTPWARVYCHNLRHSNRSREPLGECGGKFVTFVVKSSSKSLKAILAQLLKLLIRFQCIVCYLQEIKHESFNNEDVCVVTVSCDTNTAGYYYQVPSRVEVLHNLVTMCL